MRDLYSLRRNDRSRNRGSRYSGGSHLYSYSNFYECWRKSDRTGKSNSVSDRRYNSSAGGGKRVSASYDPSGSQGAFNRNTTADNFSGGVGKMKILCVTNNPAVGKKYDSEEIEVKFQNTTAREILLTARDFLIEGWSLAADPRGGYNKRFNPYHTVFLWDKTLGARMGEEVLALEQAAIFANSPYRPDYAFSEADLSDMKILDASIADETYRRLMGYRDLSCCVSKEKG